jgi:hypothetical protein
MGGPRVKENKYDDKIFFDKYSNMERSIKGLEGAGEWYELKSQSQLRPRMMNCLIMRMNYAGL